MRRWIALAFVILFFLSSGSTVWARSWRVESHPLRRSRHTPTPKDPAVAGALSTVLPGMGQIYAGSPGKGVLFLLAEATLITAAGIQIDRALYYDDQADRYDRFYDSYSDEYLTYEQGYNRARVRGWLGAGLLLTGVGVHIWNIQDAVATAQQQNRFRRFSLDIRSIPEPQLACSVRF